jgi:hypothetical protein
MGQALSAPVINDVSTDLADPPLFTQSAHPAELPDHVQAAVASAYPDLQPLRVPVLAVAEVQAAAKAAAAAGLPRCEVVHEGEGALELLDVTALLRFKDDISVR